MAAAALDSAPEMVAHAAAAAAAAGLRLQALVGDMRSCEGLPSGEADVVAVLLGSFSHLLGLDDATACLRACRRLLAPRGVLVLELAHPAPMFSGEFREPGVWECPWRGAAVRVSWGAEGDAWSDSTQILQRTVLVEELAPAPAGVEPHRVQRALRAVVPARLHTLPEMQLLLSAAGLRIAELHGALEAGISMEAPEAERMVLVCTLDNTQ